MKSDRSKIQSLVPAYLDGSLSGPNHRKVEQYLETDEGAEFLASLTATWDLLDVWESPKPSYNFKAKVFDRVRKEACPNAVMTNWRQWTFQLLGLACLCFFLGALALQLPNSNLLHEQAIANTSIEGSETVDDEILALIEESSISVLPNPTLVAMEESFAWPIDASFTLEQEETEGFQ